MNDLAADNHAIVSVEKAHLRRKTRSLYLACEDLDFRWDEKQVKRVERMWRYGSDIWEIAEVMRRDPDEVMVLLIDRARHGRIKPRRNGVYRNDEGRWT